MSAARFLQSPEVDVTYGDIVHGSSGDAPHRASLPRLRGVDPSCGRVDDLHPEGQAPEVDGPISLRARGASDVLVFPALRPTEPVELRAPEGDATGEGADGPAVEFDGRGQVVWTDALKAEVTRLWLDPELGAEQIALRLGLPSKNVVIGMARRLGAGAKPKPARPVKSDEEVAAIKEQRRAANRDRHKKERERIAALPPEERPKRAARPSKPREAKVHNDGVFGPHLPNPKLGEFTPAPEIMAGTRRFEALDVCACRWPVGDPSASWFRFCGRPKPEVSDIPYCREHAAVAYMEAPAKKDVRPLKTFYGVRRR